MEQKLIATAVRPYVIAVVSTGTATWFRSMLSPALGSECPFSLFYLSVLLTAWLAGTYPAIVSLILGTIAAAHFFINPEYSLFIPDASGILNATIYVIVNCVAIGLFASLKHQRTEMERRLQENERLSLSLKIADERKDEYLALLAHELRNPLAPLRSSLTRLQFLEGNWEGVNKVRIVCQRQVHQLVRLVDDLLDVSRFLRGNLKLQTEPLDLRVAIEAAIEMTEEMMAKKSHRFQMLLPSNPVWVVGDSVRITQMIGNLLGNAAKYTPGGGRILLQVESHQGMAKIMVSDNGIGFPGTEAERIFEPFIQMDTSRTREYGGLGIGLAIVRQIVVAHGGTILAESRGPGTGSRFSAMLPMATQEQSILSSTVPLAVARDKRGIDTASSEGMPRCTANSGSSSLADIPCDAVVSLLIVEDNVDAAEAMAELLALEGYAVQVVNDPISALQKLEFELPDIILMDIGLPGIDGYELTRKIRERWKSRPIRIIALSGWGREKDRNETAQAGFDHHLVKPVDLDDLLPLLRINHQLVNNW